MVFSPWERVKFHTYIIMNWHLLQDPHNYVAYLYGFNLISYLKLGPAKFSGTLAEDAGAKDNYGF